MRGEPAGPTHETLAALNRAHHGGDTFAHVPIRDVLRELGRDDEVKFLEPGVKSQAVLNPKAFADHVREHGEVMSRHPHHEGHKIPLNGHPIYFRHPDGSIMAVGHSQGARDTGEGFEATHGGVRLVEPGFEVHSPEERRAYEAGYQGEGPEWLRGMTGADAAGAAEEINTTTDYMGLRERLGIPPGVISYDAMAALRAHAAREGTHPARREYERLGAHDAKEMHAFGHSAEGMRSDDPADDLDRWAVRHAGPLMKSIREAFQSRGLPPVLPTIQGRGGDISRPGRAVPGGEFPATLRDPVVHTLLDEAYPRWQQHLAEGGRAGKEAFGQILNGVIDEHFPAHEHPYDAMTDLLDSTGNPHDVDREDHHLRQEKRRADAAKGWRARDLVNLSPSTFEFAAAMGRGENPPIPGDAVHPADQRMPGWQDNYRSGAREILRRVKAWNELPEAVKAVSQYSDRLNRLLTRDPEIGGQVLDAYHGSHSGQGDRRVGAIDAAAHMVKEFEPVARAFEHHRQGQGGAARMRREGPPARMARAGQGSFQNPGAMAPAGKGVDFPGQYPQQGPIRPPQPWQTASPATAAAARGRHAGATDAATWSRSAATWSRSAATGAARLPRGAAAAGVDGPVGGRTRRLPRLDGAQGAPRRGDGRGGGEATPGVARRGGLRPYGRAREEGGDESAGEEGGPVP